MDPAAVQLVVLAAGRSVRMGRDKLIAPFAGMPLARRVVGAVAALAPVVVATPAVAAALDGLTGLHVVTTAATSGPSATLALADAAVPTGVAIAVIACDLPFLDAERVRIFLAAVPEGADIAYPMVDGVPGHPVLWSTEARTRIAALGERSPSFVRGDPRLHVVGMPFDDDAYVVDVDTPDAWRSAEARAARGGEGIG